MRPVQFFLLPCVLFVLAKVIRVYKQRGMRTIEFLLWALVWIGSAFIVAFPDATSFLAHIVGIGRGADLIIYTSLVVVFYLIFRIHLMLDRLEQEVTEIVRSIALERLKEPKEPSFGERQ